MSPKEPDYEREAIKNRLKLRQERQKETQRQMEDTQKIYEYYQARVVELSLTAQAANCFSGGSESREYTRGLA
jgi:hypothetical protein